MTLNGVMTADARYLCNTWASSLFYEKLDEQKTERERWLSLFFGVFVYISRYLMLVDMPVR